METIHADDLAYIVVGVDPTGSSHNECGIVAAGIHGKSQHGYVIDDCSLLGSPNQWANAVIDCADRWEADCVVAEHNFGGDMVRATIMQAASARHVNLVYREVRASRGKSIRAEPIAALFEQGRCHIAGSFPLLEEEMCGYVPGLSTRSPNRLDAMVWALTVLMLGLRKRRQQAW